MGEAKCAGNGLSGGHLKAPSPAAAITKTIAATMTAMSKRLKSIDRLRGIQKLNFTIVKKK
jgi:hypothetical protein